ncbi:MAG: UDP-N-acetylmuramoyl-L-alanyl-D-glutamate--2,6-diaminopimelate ligase, partial [Xanthomonadales bacterium]|nr:UDP-N-acetylmuramoyl-L-alanyl-D-glutamate--2,6-diaminopimelate ligase [Xanthomonadales bacterium]
EGARVVAMEVSSHALDQGRVDGVRFDVAVFSNLTQDHLDYHGDMQAYGAAKARLFQRSGLRAAVVNLDDPFGRELFATLSDSLRR